MSTIPKPTLVSNYILLTESKSSITILFFLSETTVVLFFILPKSTVIGWLFPILNTSSESIRVARLLTMVSVPSKTTRIAR